MNTFPTIDTGPRIKGFVEEYPPDAVKVAPSQSGRPIIIPQFTGNKKTWQERRQFVSTTDKDSIYTFYEDNKDTEFYWLNEQDSTTYTVVFLGPPECSIIDDDLDEWDMQFTFGEA